MKKDVYTEVYSIYLRQYFSWSVKGCSAAATAQLSVVEHSINPVRCQVPGFPSFIARNPKQELL